MARDALTHDQIRDLAEWAAGDAHDGLSAVTGAVRLANHAGVRSVHADHLDAGFDAVPTESIALGRVLVLGENRQRVLYELITSDGLGSETVTQARDAITTHPDIELSASTIRRMLYELADVGVLGRIPVDRSSGKGRPPSRLEPRFPTLVFRELFERWNAG